MNLNGKSNMLAGKMDIADRVSGSPPQIRKPLFFGEFLDGVAQHRARHLMDMLTEKLTQQIHGYAFTHFA